MPARVWTRSSTGPCIDAPGRPRSFKPPGTLMLSVMVIKNGSLCPLRHLMDASTDEPSGPKAENRGTVHGERGGRETIFLLERMRVSRDTPAGERDGPADPDASGGVRRRGEKVTAKAARRVTSPAGQPDFGRQTARYFRAGDFEPRARKPRCSIGCISACPGIAQRKTSQSGRGYPVAFNTKLRSRWIFQAQKSGGMIPPHPPSFGHTRKRVRPSARRCRRLAEGRRRSATRSREAARGCGGYVPHALRVSF